MILLKCIDKVMTIMYNIFKLLGGVFVGNNNYKFSVRIEKKNWKQFKKETDKLGLSASNVIRLFIKKFNENPNNIKKLFD